MRRHGRLREWRGRRLDGRSLPVWGDVRIFSLLGFSLLRRSGSRASGEPEPRALLGEPPGKGSVSRIAAGRASLLRQSLRTFPMPGETGSGSSSRGSSQMARAALSAGLSAPDAPRDDLSTGRVMG